MSDFDRALNRQVDREESAIERYGFGFSKQGESFVRKFYPQLADRIGADRVLPKDKTVWRLLRKLRADDETLATQLLFAATNVSTGDEIGTDEDGNKNSWDQAVWIGNYFGQEDRGDAFKVGRWGIGMLRAVPAFKFDGEILSLPLTDDLDSFLTEVVKNDTIRNGLVWPTLERPVPWTQVRAGGLPSTHWAQRPLVNRRLIEPIWRKAIGTGQMRPPLDALNHLQSTAFVINKPILDFVKRLGFSKRPPVSYDFRSDEDFHWAIAEWTQLARSWALDMEIADWLSAQDRFYIPLALEFRGRVSPIPCFHYQRDDHIRGLFLFRDAYPINWEARDNLFLLAYAGARADGNQWSGVEKPSRMRPKDRFDWALANIETIERIGRDVLSGANLNQVRPLLDGIDDPCQFIATCAEIVLAKTSGETRLPLLMDMSNSALQHWGSLVRAPETKYANLTANRAPEDHYLEVTRDVFRTGADCTKLMRGAEDRAIVKGAIVAHSYGSRPGWIKSEWIRRGDKFVRVFKSEGMTRGIVKTLKKRGPLPLGITKLAPKLASLILHADNKRTPFVQDAKKFINAIARRYSKHGIDFRWMTNLGVGVINCCRLTETTRVRYFDFHKNKWRKKTVAVRDTDEIDRLGANRAAGANFIHSMDGIGGHLGMIALEAAKENIPIMTVHDCVGPPAPYYLRTLNIVRDTFVQLHQNDESLLGEILDRAKQDLPSNVKLPRLPKRGDQDINEARLSHNMCK
jgi:DNA-directed RNA polymerase